jgi:hypothetical protein
VTDNKFYTVHSDTRITLSADAREMARMAGMTDTEMARHLLAQDKLRAAGTLQKDGHDGA